MGKSIKMEVSELQSLETAKNFCENLLNQKFGFRTSKFTIEDFGFPYVQLRITEYPQQPFLSIFNRSIQNTTNGYFSYNFEVIKKRTFKEKKNREKFHKRWFSSGFTPLHNNDVVFDESLNYDSPFLSIENAFDFFDKWLPTIFSQLTIKKYFGDKNINSVLAEYLEKFSDSRTDIWKLSSDIIRITEVRNDLRIVLTLNPIDLRPELSITSIEEKGLATTFIALIYDWFSYRNILRLVNKVSLNFDYDSRFRKFPLVFNAEQIFTLCATPFIFNEIEWLQLLKKGARRQRKFYNNYFLDLIDLFPWDVFGKSEFDADEIEELPLIDEKVKYFNGRRIYFKAEFNLVIVFYAKLADESGDNDYPEFFMHMHYQPFTSNPQPVEKWNEHFILDDLGK